MAKQKIVVKLAMHNDKKLRKALKIVVGVCGVDSASLVGSDKDQIEVTGEGIDSVQLTTLLRKGVGHTELLSVGLMEEEKVEPAEEEPTMVPMQIHPYHYHSYNGSGMPYYYRAY
ncbi:hypothetical protein Tco_0250294 [Tanacetum coccineum]